MAPICPSFVVRLLVIGTRRDEMVTSFRARTAVVLAGVTASFAFAGAPASAQVAPIYVQAVPNLRAERVSYYDLNLATRAGEQTLHRRVGHAVERVCLYDQGRWYGLAEPDYNYCSWGAWKRARPQMMGAVYRARLAYYGRYWSRSTRRS
jgi:UrcA family protein